MSDAKAFEKALAANPDDLAGWCAFADYLVEQGDPRGEFMQTQIALEDEARPKKDRAVLKRKEAALLKKHERAWLGDLAPHLLDRDETLRYPSNPEYAWRRGFLADLKVDYLTVRSAQALAAAPVARFLRALRVGRDARDYEMDGLDQPPARVPAPPGADYHWELFELIGAPCLKNLRVFQMGDEEPPEDGSCDCHTYAMALEHVIATMPRIEELHLLCKGYSLGGLFALKNLKNLRVLRIYAAGSVYGSNPYAFPLDVLAGNRALGNLTHLMLHPHYAFDQSFLPYGAVAAVLRSKHLKSLTHLQVRMSDMGDDGVREIVASGILKRLKWLDLRYGCITDEGARLFAACADAKNLERLDLSRNGVTAAGLAVLRKAKVNAIANRPFTESELNDHEHLHEGDFE